MISFENVDKFNIHFYIQMHYLRFALKYVFYRKVYVKGLENIPKNGEPVFVISNHQNGMMDPINILTNFPDKRLPVFIARGDIFKKDAIAKILRYFRIMPTFRSRDGGRSDIMQNNVTFSIAAKILQRGGTMIMFPEAGHQHGRYLSTFKKGFPRICFAAEEESDFNLNLQILPMNLHYSDYFSFGEKVLITIGEPFKIQEFFEQYKAEPNKAYFAMNDKARERVKALSIDIKDPELYEEFDLLRTMVSTARVKEQGLKVDFPELYLEEKKVIDDLDNMREQEPAKFENLMEKTKEYMSKLHELRLPDWVVGEKITFPNLLLRFLLGVIVAPFAIFGLINNALPFFSCNALIDKVKDPMLHSSVRFGMGFFVFPVYYLILLGVVWGISHSLGFALAYLVATFITLYFLMYTIRGVKRFIIRCHYYFTNRRNFLFQKALALKEQILKIMC